MSNTIALCIPAYNAEKYLLRLLTSANNQTVPFDEILVYNDCSTDNTETVAKDLGAEVVNGDINRGCSHGKNQLANISKSDWLHFHDADDDLYPHFVETAQRWINKPDCPDVVVFSYEYKDYETGKLLSIKHYDSDELKKDSIGYVIDNKIVSICGIYNKKNFLEVGGYDLDPNVLYNEDEAFHHRLARSGISFDADNTVTIINYKLSNSMSSDNQLKCAVAHYHVLKKTAEAVEPKYFSEISKELRKNAGVLASFLDWETADKAMNLALKLDKKKDLYGSKSFRFISKIDPYLALRIREYSIRLLKPKLRKNN